MMIYRRFLLTVSTFIACSLAVAGVELTFELPDNEKQCFHENIPLNTTATLEFQVVSGGQYDVDVSLEAPNKEIIYKQIKTQFDTHTFVAKIPGVYAVCFSNEFSTFSHKIIYMDFQVGEEQPLPGLGEHVTVMTQMESSAQEIHKHLSTIDDYQTHHRLKEAKGRKRAEELNERVMWWSILETIVILVSAVGQVFIVKNFFSEKKTIQVNSRIILFYREGFAGSACLLIAYRDFEGSAAQVLQLLGVFPKEAVTKENEELK